MWNPDVHPPLEALAMPANTIARFGPDPDFFLFHMGNIAVVETATLEMVRTLDDSERSSISLTYSHDGTMAAAGSLDGLVRIWKVDDGTLLAAIDTQAGWLVDIDFSPDDDIIAASGSMLALCDVASGEVIEHRDNGGFSYVEYTPDGELLLYHQPLAITHDGSMIARSEFDGEVRLTHDSAPGDVISLPGSGGQLMDVAFNRSGRYLATAEADGRVQLWSTDGQLLATLIGDIQNTWLVIAPDGRVDGSESGRDDVLYWEAGTIRLPGFVGWQRHHTPELLRSLMPASK